MRFSCPGKTFLLGEYLALAGGLSLVAATRPRFSMTVSLCSDGGSCAEAEVGVSAAEGSAGFLWSSGKSKAHPDSPAGRFAEQNGLYLSDFVDGYQALGGFGASTAQFLAVWAAVQGTQNAGLRWTATDLLNAYRAVAWNGEGRAPSGVDLIAQWQGGLTWIETSKLADGSGIDRVMWPFLDLDFSLFHTNKKLATHEHLRSVREFSVEPLARIAFRAREKFVSGDSLAFSEAVEEYGRCLAEQGLVARHTLEILASLKKQSLPGVLGAKGCGALGADVVLILHRPEALASLRLWGETHGMRWIADKQSIDTRGLVCGDDV